MLSFAKQEEDDNAPGKRWTAHPLQLKYNRAVRTFYQFQEEKAECEVKLETTIDFAKTYVTKQKQRWDEERDTLHKRIHKLRNRYLMNLEDIEILKQRLVERKKRSADKKLAIKLLKKDVLFNPGALGVCASCRAPFKLCQKWG